MPCTWPLPILCYCVFYPFKLLVSFRPPELDLNPFLEIKNNEEWFFGLIFCKFYRTIKVMNFLVSISFLTLMSVDRYNAISGSSYRQVLTTGGHFSAVFFCHFPGLKTQKRPVRQRRRPPKSAHVISLAVWLVSFGLSIPGTEFLKIKNSFENSYLEISIQC